LAAFFPRPTHDNTAHSDEFGVVPLNELIEQRVAVPRLNLGDDRREL
jgi:hypothetical protein